MAQYNGTAGDDTYVGGADQDQIYGEGGKDQLSGGDNYDYIDGGADDDVINGDGDQDLLVGGDGNDVVNGGTGFDEIFGDAGNDVLSGGTDDDILYGGTGNDSLSGGEGNDFLRGGAGVDSYDGGADDGVKLSFASGVGDKISFAEPSAGQGAVADLRTGIISNDGFGNAETMTGIESLGGGTAFADQLYGNDGANSISGGRGDTLMAFGGDDFLHISGAAAILDGGTGVDHLTLASSGGLVPNNAGTGGVPAPSMTTGYVVDLAAQTLTDGHNLSGSIVGIERIKATDLADVIRGSAADEWFAPGLGSDTIDGRGGVDTLSYTGSSHYDYYFSHQGGIFVDLAAGQAIETIAQYQIVDGGPMQGRTSPPGGTVGAGATAESTDTIAGIENVEGTGLGDTIYGDGADNRIAPGAGNDIVDGRGGVDTIDYSTARAAVVVRLDQGTAVESGTGETNIDPAVPDYFLGVTVEADDYSEKTDQLANIENAIGSAFADTLVGNAEANRLEGGAGNDLLQAGTGTDTLLGGEGNDALYFGADFSGADVADGGAGRDAIVFQGNVALVLGNSSIANIESISLQSGATTKFGDTANNRYDFSVTTAEGNVAAGQQLIVNAQSLLAGEDFTFDGSAETDGKFLIYAGHGTDILKGGAGVDVFFFEGDRWGPNDRVDGGAGRDSMVISGGTGLKQVTFGADSFTNIESISVNATLASDPTAKPSYEFVLHNGNVAPGGNLILNANSIIDPSQTVRFDGGAVIDGTLTMYAGAGNDVLIGGAGGDLLYGGLGKDNLTGNAGADIFQWRSTSESSVANPDNVLDFQGSVDKIDLSRIDADTLTAGDQAFRSIGSAAFTGGGAAGAGEMRVLNYNSYWLIEGDTDGNGVADFAISVTTQGNVAMLHTDFVL